MPRRTDTRERVLRTAATLFQTQGYHATGLNQVLAEGGAPKGSLYFHFPGGKEQLASEALTLAGAEMCLLIKTALDAAEKPEAAVDTVLAHLADALTASDFTAGCPVATVALDTAGSSDTIRSACDEVYRSWTDTIAAYLVAHGADADRAATLAVVLLASIEGALLLARTRRDVAPLLAVGAHLRPTLAEALR
ncbi:TetR/AcrR family transcriptional regulator [Streptomyces boluensis]|uniref:TetR family transcriptional regulator n=1 Tax=Streptomyces boluensis TaxID=1775135 RepID=A0A964UKE9_9ACTN|nr:TetR/AcrR family transcriptional regulator [Streptomyces boluensis]NBE50247.1 TetR family transcriptional regulator [Streptomyces boluensis]